MSSTLSVQGRLRKEKSARRFKGSLRGQQTPFEIGRVLAAKTIALPQPAQELSLDQQNIQSRVVARLDRAASAAEMHDRNGFILGINETLRSLKSDVSDGDWQDVVLPTARVHPLAGHVTECPLTRHSLTRPRGYPGDAGLLDLIYRHADAQPVVAASSDTGRDVYGFTNDTSVCEAVRQRRKLLAERIDRIAAARPGAEMLAVACGHLREAEISVAMRGGRIGRFIATDQDLDSLRVVEGYREHVSPAIEARKLSVRDFISGRHDLGTFDFVYAAGLYDYLDDRIAMRLTRRLFSLLKPGGTLLVANFLTGCMEVPYMEVFMDWHLLYRTEAEIKAFASEISDVDLADVTYYQDARNCIGYMELQRI